MRLTKNQKKHQVKKRVSEMLKFLRDEVNNEIDKKIDNLPKKDGSLNNDNYIIENEIIKKYFK